MTATKTNARGYREALYARTPFSPRVMARLWSARVGVVGIGSGGSQVALDLARAGVGHLRLADPASLTITNLCRHELGQTYVGKNKARGVGDRINEVNPHISVDVFEEDILADEADEVRRKFFSELDLVVDATDVTAVRLSVNREVVERGIAGVFGGCYESAIGGEVLIWVPGWNVPCLECLRGGLTQPDERGDIDYSAAQRPEDYTAEPGLFASIKLITSVETELALAVLLREEGTSELGKLVNPQRTFLLIGGARAEGFYRFRKEFDIHWQPLRGPRRDCGACQSRNSGGSSDELLEQMKGELPDVLKEIANLPKSRRG